jgi:hypothetical protein
MVKNPLYDKLIDRIEKSKHELVDLCLNLGNTPSYHGKEENWARRSSLGFTTAGSTVNCN